MEMLILFGVVFAMLIIAFIGNSVTKIALNQLEKEDKEYKSYQCQKCGEYIGWLGRFVEWICCGLIKHKCKKNKL